VRTPRCGRLQLEFQGFTALRSPPSQPFPHRGEGRCVLPPPFVRRRRLGWRGVRARWWRALHIASWAAVAVQAALGRACFLTLWQDDLTGAGGSEPPLIMRFVNSLIYWPLPMWVFTAVYLALFGLVIALWWLVPPERRIIP